MTKSNFIFVFLLSFALNGQIVLQDSFAGVQTDSLANINLNNEGLPLDTETSTLEEEQEKSRLVKKADGLFNKMWYAEAAKYYDLAIKKSKVKPSKYLLSRAGDSHYFNSNIKQAYEHYNKLYKDHENNISENTLFNFVHTLKGTGRKRRANRIISILNKKNIKDNNTDSTNSIANTKELELKNLKINSEYSDFSPMYFGKDKLLYASAKDTLFLNTRRYKWDNQPYLELYTAKVDTTNNDASGTYRFSKKVNTKYHEASASFSPDKKTIYFTRNNYKKKKKLRRDKKGVNHLKLYMSKEIDGNWTEAVELPFNSDNYSTGHPAVSADGKKLFFVSDMPGGYGGTDIYVVDVLDNGSYSEPVNLGLAVNSNRKEMFPFITENTLYFSSNRTNGLGGLDIYKSKFGPEGYNKAQNLGAPFNSARDDFSFIIDEETEKGYFASNRPGGKGRDDIYSFVPTRKEMPNLNEISGYIVDIITGDSLSNATVALYDTENIKVGEIKTNDKGSFRFNNLKSTTDYTLQTILEGYFEETVAVATKTNEIIDVIQPMKQIEDAIVEERGVKKVKTENILFDFDKSNINSNASKELDKLVQVMLENPTMVIKIESHTDAIGNAAYNKYLSGKRATSTKAYLIANGIDSNRIESAIGYGEERLLNECGDGVRCSKTKHRQNRRSEFIIVNM